MAKDFDAIVIGSGLGGLTAGALYARAGHRVLMLERNSDFGGAAAVYRHGALSIEASLHEIDGLDGEDPKMPLLRSLGLDDDVPFVDVGDLMEVRSSLVGKPFILPHGFEAALAATKQRFPNQSPGIEQYFERIRAVRHAVVTMHPHEGELASRLWNAITLPERLLPLIRDRHATLSEVLQRLFGDDEAIKLALASNLAYYTDDPDTMPFISFAVAQASYISGGGHYVRGGSRVLSDRLVAIIVGAGGSAAVGREVFEIALTDGRASGVGHRGANGDIDRAFAPVIFGNAAPNVLAEMLPENVRPLFETPFADRRPSISLWTISLGLTRPSRELGVTRYSTAVFPDWMTSLNKFKEASAFLGSNAETRIPPYMLVAYDRIDSGLNVAGPYLASIVGVDRLQNWLSDDAGARQERKERWMDRIVSDLDRQFTGFSNAIAQREMSTASTLHHYLNTPGGAVYGFAPQNGNFTTAAKTTIAGLYLASAFTNGGGYTGAMLGGASAARAAVKDVARERGVAVV